MRHHSKRGQVDPTARAVALPLRHEAARASRCALALVVLLGLATVSVLATTSALSQAHAERLAASLRL